MRNPTQNLSIIIVRAHVWIDLQAPATRRKMHFATSRVKSTVDQPSLVLGEELHQLQLGIIDVSRSPGQAQGKIFLDKLESIP